MPVDTYLTIEKPSEGSYKEKGSRFLAFAYPVKTEEEIKSLVENLKRKYFDARHHCFAWVLGPEKNQSRAFDDGEPNHSAGDPIMGQIKSKDLTNILVVVVRYFGGVKLGVGGLIAAYRSAANEALSRAVVIRKDVTELFQLKFPYSSMPKVMKLINQFEIKVIDRSFQEAQIMKVEVKLKDKRNLEEKVKLLNDLQTPVEMNLIAH
jgi:uncharacterized YigZ family protein